MLKLNTGSADINVASSAANLPQMYKTSSRKTRMWLKNIRNPFYLLGGWALTLTTGQSLDDFANWTDELKKNYQFIVDILL